MSGWTSGRFLEDNSLKNLVVIWLALLELIWINANLVRISRSGIFRSVKDNYFFWCFLLGFAPAWRGMLTECQTTALMMTPHIITTSVYTILIPGPTPCKYSSGEQRIILLADTYTRSRQQHFHPYTLELQICLTKSVVKFNFHLFKINYYNFLYEWL